MTRIYLGRDEWWPVPDPRPGDDDPDAVDIDQSILDRYIAAAKEFNAAWNEIGKAAAAAGDRYWQADT